MNTIRTMLKVSLLIITSAAATQATVLRAFVSSTGNDGNIGVNCVQATPCRTFNVAIGAVTAGGELIALDTAGYGPITNINKAITIAAVPGATAFVVVAASTTGFMVNGGFGDLIALSNISFNGSNAANTRGVNLQSGNLSIRNCDFRQLNIGVRIASPGSAVLRDSAFQSNQTGVLVTPGKVDIENCLISHNHIGVLANADGGAQNNPPNGQTLVRIDRGDVTLNTIGFQMDAPGLKPMGGVNGFNIFVRVTGNGVVTTNIIDNTTFLVVTNNASQCGADPCVSPVMGTYNSQLP